MKTEIYNLIEAILNIALIIIAGICKFLRRQYRRFCINILWERFQIKTSVYKKWHDRRAREIQILLDEQHSYITF